MVKTYRTQQGDTWDLIAYRLYPLVGREMCMDRLLAENEQYREVVVFSAGAVLAVPDIKIPAVVNLPPWKRT